MIVVHVSGTPAPKGSFRVVTRGRGGKPLPFPKVLDDGPKTTAWAHAVRAAATIAMIGRVPFEGVPLEVVIEFRFDRPAGHRRKDGTVKPTAPRSPSVKPDIDKLLRATFDALEGVAFDGDSRIVDVSATKRYATGHMGSTRGATIHVQEAA